MLVALPCMSRAGEPALTKRQVVRLADAAVKREGINLHGYRRDNPVYNPLVRDWLIFYNSRTDKNGFMATNNVFCMHISDGDKQVRFSPGP